MFQKESPQKTRTHLKIIILIGFILLLVLNINAVLNGFKYIYRIIFPLLLGAAMAYVLNILVIRFEKIYFPRSHSLKIMRSRRGICILLSFVSIILVLLFFLRILIPQVVQTIDLLLTAFPSAYNNVVEWVAQYADEIPFLQGKLAELNMDETAILKKGLQLLANWGWGTVSFMGTVFGTIMNFILALIFSLYILINKENLKDEFDKLFRAYMRDGRREKFYIGLQTAHETFSGYFVGQFKEAIILGMLCTLGMLLFRFPYATIIGPIIGLTALIPIVGAYIGGALGVLLIVTFDPIKAVMFIVFLVILQQIEGNFIYPKVVGESIGLPGLWVFAAVIVGGSLLGIAGILLGVPFAATAYKLLGKSVNERLMNKIN